MERPKPCSPWLRLTCTRLLRCVNGMLQGLLQQTFNTKYAAGVVLEIALEAPTLVPRPYQEL